MSVYLELLRLGVMALHGETLGQRATIHGAVREAVGRSALISATLTPLCSPQVLACLLSCMCANVWRVSGVLMRWIWLVASTDAMDALGVAPAVRTCLLLHLLEAPRWEVLCYQGLPSLASTQDLPLCLGLGPLSQPGCRRWHCAALFGRSTRHICQNGGHWSYRTAALCGSRGGAPTPAGGGRVGARGRGGWKCAWR